MTSSRTFKMCTLFLTIAMIVSFATGMTACSGTTLHTDHDQAATDITDTPMDVVDYRISFTGKNANCNRSGAIVTDGNSVVLIKAGVYHLTGNFEGQLQVSVAQEQQVTLIMDDLTITCQDSAALYVKNADHVYIEVPKDKTATLTDATEYIYTIPGETKPNACIYSADDITFRGLGTLNVVGNCNNGIGCKNDIVFKSGQVNVTAVNNGVKGVSSVTLQDTASLSILYAEDGIKSDGITVDEGKILITDQAVASIFCADDAIQATMSAIVEAGSKLYYDCQGNIVNCDGVSNIAEGTLIPLVLKNP